MNLDARGCAKSFARLCRSQSVRSERFIAATIRTSCSVKPRVVIFHISASNSTEACLCGECGLPCACSQGQIWRLWPGNMVAAQGCTSGRGNLHTFGGMNVTLLGDWKLSSVAGLGGAFCRKGGRQWTTIRVRSSPLCRPGQPARWRSANSPTPPTISRPRQ